MSRFLFACRQYAKHRRQGDCVIASLRMGVWHYCKVGEYGPGWIVLHSFG